MKFRIQRIARQFVYTLLCLFIFLNVVAAFHAYKLTHFYDDKKAVISKPELMSGVDKVKAVLFGISSSKLPLTVVPAHPYQTFHTTTNDSLLLEGWFVPKEPAKGTVILFHGHGGNRSGVVSEADAFHNFGYNVCMVDFRAHGNSGGNICTIGYKESADVKAAYDYVKAKGDSNIILWGISLGAAAITKAMDDYPEIKPRKVILEMPFGSLNEAVEGRFKMMHLPAEPLSAMLTFWGGTEQGFWAFGLKPSAYAKHVKVPVLLQWGEKDQRVSKKETEAIFNNLSSTQKELVIYNYSGHQSLLKNEPHKWLSTVKSFLQQ